MIILLIFIISIAEKFESVMINDINGCLLIKNLEGWNSTDNYKLLDSYISLDTLNYEFDPRYGMYINAIARVRIDSLGNGKSSITVDDILIYGDPFERSEFKKYFILQYEAYVHALVDKYPLKKRGLLNNCTFMIHQEKFRSCN